MATLARGGPTAVLTTTATSYVAAGTNEAVILSRVNLYNSDTVSRTVTIHRVPTAGSATTSNIIYFGAISPGETLSPNLPGLILDNGDALYAKADAASVVNIDLNYTVASQA